MKMKTIIKDEFHTEKYLISTIKLPFSCGYETMVFPLNVTPEEKWLEREVIRTNSRIKSWFNHLKMIKKYCKI